MSEANGGMPDFTHKLSGFTLNGQQFRRVKIRARDWAEKLAEVGARENVEVKKKEGSVLFGVSSEGLYELIRLGIHPDDLDTWDQMYNDGQIEFGELAGLREWMWEQMMERPFTSATPSSDGPGESTAPSSKGASSSPAVTPTG